MKRRKTKAPERDVLPATGNEHIFSVPDVFRITLPNLKVPYYIMPFGDVHLHSPNHSESAWEEFLDTAKAMIRKHKYVYFISMGDEIQ